MWKAVARWGTDTWQLFLMHNDKNWRSFLSFPKDRKDVYKLVTATALQDRLY